MVNITKYIGKKNIADLLSKEKIQHIGNKCLKELSEDIASRQDKDQMLDYAQDIAQQIVKGKDFPFPGASNINYPLTTKAVIEFNSRVSPLIINNGEIVKIKAYGSEDQLTLDDEGNPVISEETQLFQTDNEEKNSRATKVKDVMNWLLLEKTDWEEQKDRLTMVYALSGFCATKNYFDYSENLPRSELVLPRKLYWEKGKTFDKASRKSHLFEKSKNWIIENMRLGLFSDDDELLAQDRENYELAEHYTCFDLDDDGYKEPYIVVFERESGKVLRVVANFGEDDIIKRDGKIAKITPQEYLVFYQFMPALDGTVYPIGLADILLFINKVINANLNQLVDAGTLANTSGGFVSNNLKVAGGDLSVMPGQWKKVNAGMDILSQAFFPIPTKEPSQTLFSLLGVMIDAGKELAMLPSILSGDIPANVPASTVLALIEQSLSGFKAIVKRLHRSLKKELNLEYKMIYENFEEIKKANKKARVLQDVKKSDFADDYLVVPVSDDYYSTSLERSAKANYFMSLADSANPFINKLEATRRALQTFGVDKYQDLIVEPQPAQPDPLAQIQIQLAEAQIGRINVQNQIDLIKATLEKMKTDSEISNKDIDTQSNAQKRLAEGISALATAESKQAGINNPEYIRQTAELGELSNQLIRERKVDERKDQSLQANAGDSGLLQPGGSGDVQIPGAGQSIL